MRLSPTTEQRIRLLGRDAVISAAQAAILLPGADAAAARWLRSVPGLVQVVGSVECVVWGAVADALSRREVGTTSAPRAPVADLPPPDPDL